VAWVVVGARDRLPGASRIRYGSGTAMARTFVAPAAEPAQLQAAIARVLDRTTGSSVERLGQAAQEGFSAAPAHPEVARTFQALLTVGYLVAAADGLAAEEREALAGVLARAAGHAVDRAAFDERLSELEAERRALGDDALLRRAAEALVGPFAAREAVVFAALVSLGDGALAADEVGALVRLADHLHVPHGEVYALVDDAIRSIVRALAELSAGA
jgi:hypothetical protein